MKITIWPRLNRSSALICANHGQVMGSHGEGRERSERGQPVRPRREMKFLSDLINGDSRDGV